MLPDITQRFPEGQTWIGISRYEEHNYLEEKPIKRSRKSKALQRVQKRKLRNKFYKRDKDLPF